MSDMPEKPKRGRPRRHADQVVPAALTVRVTQDLLDKVKVQAAKNGRSIAAEVERRLEVSFQLADVPLALDPISSVVEGALKDADAVLFSELDEGDQTKKEDRDAIRRGIATEVADKLTLDYRLPNPFKDEPISPEKIRRFEQMEDFGKRWAALYLDDYWKKQMALEYSDGSKPFSWPFRFNSDSAAPGKDEETE